MKTLNLILLLLLGTLLAHAQEKVGGSSTNTVTVGKQISDSLSSVSVKTTGSYNNPTWIGALSAAKVTQSSTLRFTTDAEKASWNAKPDLSAVRQIASDTAQANLKNVTFVGATATSNGNSTTVTITGGGSSGTVDNTLSTVSTNAIANNTVTNALNGATATISANTASIAGLTTRTTTLEGQTTTNVANIAANTSTISNLSTTAQSNSANIATNTASINSLSALVVSLQSQVAALSGTFTIQAPTLTVSSIINTGAVVTWGVSTSATSYTLESATNVGFSTGLTTLTVTSATTFTLSGLTAGTTYYLRIKASGGAGTTASGYATTNFTTTNSVPTLSAPTGVAATATSASAISVSWTASSNATSYTVRYSTSPAMTSPTSTTTAGTNLAVTGLTANTAYYFDVSASASGYTTSATSSTTTATTQGSFAITQTIRIAMQTSTTSSTIASGAGTSAIANSGTWNRMIPTSAQVTSTTAGTYSLPLVNETGGATSYSASIGLPYTTATATSIASASLVAGMIYPDQIMQRAYQVSSTNTAGGSMIVSGLDPAKYYQIYTGGFTSTANVVSKYTVTGATSTFQQRTTGQAYGVSGGNEFDPNAALVFFKNVQPAANGTITILTNYVSGSSTPFNTAVLRESTSPMP